MDYVLSSTDMYIPLLRLPGSPVCEVSAYQRMVRLAPVNVSSWSAFFVLPSHYSLTDRSQNTFIAAFGRAISTTGLLP